MIDGKRIGSCLGDLYSVNWMEDIDKFGTGRTLQENYIQTQKLTTMSKVMQWGDTTWTNMTFAQIIGPSTGEATPADPRAIREAFSGAEGYTRDELRAMSAVSTYDIPMHLAYYEYLRSDKSDMEAYHTLANNLMTELNMRIQTDLLFMNLAKKVSASQWPTVFHSRSAEYQVECLAEAQRAFRSSCGEFTDYSRQYVRVLNNMCASGASTTDIAASLSQLCVLSASM